MVYVEGLAPEQQYWIVQPLVDAGLDMEQIEMLVFRLGFDGIVGCGGSALTDVTALVQDQPVEIQAAWAQAIGRMLTVDAGPDDASVPTGR